MILISQSNFFEDDMMVHSATKRRPLSEALLVAAALSCGLSSAAGQATGAPQKSQFTLFNPTPRELMREMSTDRPDATESPYTVDAGHVQFELSFFDYARNDDDGVRAKAVSVLPANIKIGLLNNVDVQFVVTPYTREETDGRGGAGDDVAGGFSDDTQIRLKINLWGNDGPAAGLGATAFAIMPFVKFPTGRDALSNDHVEGGLILPLAVALPGEVGLGLMAEIDVVYDEADDGYGVEFVHTATLGRDLVGALAGYVEYIGIAPHDTGSTYQAIASGGLTYALSDDWVLDVGATIGLSDAADDFTIFAGTSFRF
jgi:hypothetical protein